VCLECSADVSWWSYDPARGWCSAIPFSTRPPGDYPDSGMTFHVLDPIGTGFSQPGTKKRLAEVLPLVWKTIPKEFFEKLWKSIPGRVAAVLEAKGGYTKY